MDPVLAGHTLSVLNQEASSRGMTLLASLHAVELALAHFPRVIGVREGRIVFDLPPEAISPSALDALYANEQLQAVPTSAPRAPVSVQIPRC
ncbi:phosphonate ABC transporter, ATP-binding protein [compost metagenome]